MSYLGQAQTGNLSAIPRTVTVKSRVKDSLALKNCGNNHNVPYQWSADATVATGDTTVVLASGLSFYGMDLAAYGSFVATPTSNPGGAYWIEYDTGANTVTLVLEAAAAADISFKVQCVLGNAVDLSNYHTRGFGAPAQSLP